MNHGVANPITLETLTPSWGASLAFLPVIIYNFMGFELMSGAAEEMKNPARDVPKAIITAGVIIAAFYLLGTIGILLSLPMDDIGLINGVIDTLTKLFGESAFGPAIVMTLGLMALYTFVANMVTWTMGANRSAAEAANDGHLHPIFGKLSVTHKTPTNAAVVTGLVTTVAIIVYGFMAKDAADLFWTLFAFSSIVFLLCYLLMFAAFLRLRMIDADRPRAYRVPGGIVGAWIMGLLCIAFIVQAMVFFIYAPGAFDFNFAATIIGGVIVTVIVGEFLISRGKPLS
jgi:amino acid transporter